MGAGPAASATEPSWAVKVESPALITAVPQTAPLPFKKSLLFNSMAASSFLGNLPHY